jgi:MFS family permease
MTRSDTSISARATLVPLALAQFICSFAGSNMNVMINNISHDLHTTVQGVQLAITLFLLVMAALMIPGGKITDKFGGKRCFVIGLGVYGVGAVLSAVSPGLGVLILGNSILEGVGTAMLIPPVYIITTELFTDMTSRARAFGTIMAMAGVGAAAGPLIGGLITSALTWRASFAFQALVIVVIMVLSIRVKDPVQPDPTRPFDVEGAVLSAVGLTLVVLGIVLTTTSPWLLLGGLVLGALFLAWFYMSIRAKERAGREPLLSTSLFRNRTSNLGLVTQNIQWLLLMGASFVVAAYLQAVRDYSAIATGVIFTAATVGLLASSLAAGRLAKRYAQRTLIVWGFAGAVAGIGVLIVFVGLFKNPWSFAPGLLVMGLGTGLMLTPSVNIVQSSFAGSQQGEISGLSRSASNLGSSLGTAIGGTILVASLVTHNYLAALITLGVIGLGGLVTAVFLPRTVTAATEKSASGQASHRA